MLVGCLEVFRSVSLIVSARGELPKMEGSGNAVVRAWKAAQDQGKMMTQKGGNTVAREGGHETVL